MSGDDERGFDQTYDMRSLRLVEREDPKPPLLPQPPTPWLTYLVIAKMICKVSPKGAPEPPPEDRYSSP